MDLDCAFYRRGPPLPHVSQAAPQLAKERARLGEAFGQEHEDHLATVRLLRHRLTEPGLHDVHAGALRLARVPQSSH